MEQPAAAARSLPDGAGRMKQFRCPNGLRVWNAPQAGGETRFIYREIFERHCYEQHGVTIADGDVIVDVGANVGLFTLSLMERFRGLRIVCVEPVPDTRECLARNVNESPWRGRHDVTVLPDAVGSTAGQRTIAYFPQAPGNATLHLDEKRREWARLVDEATFARLWGQSKPLAMLLLPVFPWRRHVFTRFVAPVLDNARTVACDVCTMSELIRRHRLGSIDLLKIDVEGAELDVLDGIEEQDWIRIRQIAAEVAPRHKQALGAVADRLRSLGFDNVTIESVRGGASVAGDATACALFAVRTTNPVRD